MAGGEGGGRGGQGGGGEIGGGGGGGGEGGPGGGEGGPGGGGGGSGGPSRHHPKVYQCPNCAHHGLRPRIGNSQGAELFS